MRHNLRSARLRSHPGDEKERGSFSHLQNEGADLQYLFTDRRNLPPSGYTEVVNRVGALEHELQAMKLNISSNVS